jgi:putative ABC transport system substrate-binding protein
MMRREFITILGGAVAVWPLGARAEQNIPHIGFLRVGQPPAAFIGGFRQGLRELGLVEGQHFVIEFGLAQSAAQVPKVAAELANRNVDVIIASGTPSVLPARDAAGKIPVVFVATLDPVATGLVANLARPGGNVTGVTSMSGDLIAKRLQLIKELLPKVTRVAVLVRESSPTANQYVQESKVASRTLGIELKFLIKRSPIDIDEVFVSAGGSSALLVADDAEFTANRALIAELAIQNHLPTVSGLKEMVEAGGLLAYGANFGALYRRAANQVYKILQGISPARIPVEQPTKFDFVLNMRTAKALGLAVPPSLLVRADEVIE